MENALTSLFPVGISINGSTGALSAETAKYSKRASDLPGIFRDQSAWKNAVDNENPLVYEVVEFRDEASHIFFGTTTMQPGKIGGEYFMTRGHFHERRDMGEVYYTQSGRGLLLLENRQGETRTVEMLPGVCAVIPADWAHRSINVGDEPLVFVWVCSPLAGHDYGEILKKGMRKRVIAQNGHASVINNENFEPA
jgi:glucose-6-phosphate isomerase